MITRHPDSEPLANLEWYERDKYNHTRIKIFQSAGKVREEADKMRAREPDDM